MVDNINIKTNNRELVSRIKRNLTSANSSNIKMRGNDLFHIYNNQSDCDSSHLRVSFDSRFGVSCVISGSIRKWYYGQCSIKDISRCDMPKVFQLLAQNLSIKLEELCPFTVSRIEIGLNFSSKHDGSLIKSLAVKYINASYKIGDYENYRCFSSKSRNNTLKIYDKGQEIKSKIGLITNEAEDKFLKEYSTANITRVELQYSGGNKKVSKLSKLSTVGDLISRYCLLTVSFDKAIKKLTFKNIPTLNYTPIKGTRKELKDFIFLCGMDALGDVRINDCISKIQKRYKSGTKTAIASKRRSDIKQNVEGNYLLRVMRTRNRELVIGC